MLLHWLKVFHLYAVVVALGSAAAQLLLTWYYGREADQQRGRMSEEFALLVSRRLEIPALTLAVILGLAIAVVHGGYWKQGWLHAKIAIAVILLGVSHMVAASLRRIHRLRASAQANPVETEDQIWAIKSRLLIFGFVITLLAIIILYLVIARPF